MLSLTKVVKRLAEYTSRTLEADSILTVWFIFTLFFKDS